MMVNKVEGEDEPLMDSSVPTSDPLSTTTKEFKKKYVVVILVVIVLLIVAGLIAGIVVSLLGKKEPTTVILISFDGFRAKYLNLQVNPVIMGLAKEGVRAQSMRPIFPSKTFPNHYALATGLHAESHGIVANAFYDPDFDAYFSISDPKAVTDARWWGGEPIWNTVELNNQTAACCFWPGSEAPIQGIRPSYYRNYNGSFSNSERVAQIFAWLDLPADKRPNFIAAYFSVVDDLGHRYGADDGNITVALAEADRVVGLLIDGLKQRNIYDKTHFVIVSDHGMTTTSAKKVIVLDDIIDLSKVEIVDWSPITAILPKEGFEDEIYANLSAASLTQPFKAYQRDGPNFIPPQYHFKNNKRITPIILDTELGWSVSSRDFFEESPTYFDGGAHGYNNSEPDMQAIFIARGPKFKIGAVLDPFPNVEVYNLLARVLGIKPAPNNGTADSLVAKQALAE